MPWVKVRTSLLDNERFRRASRAGKLTFHTVLLLAGKLNAGGVLEIEGLGPMTVAEIAFNTGLSPKQQAEALDELCTLRLLSKNDGGAIVVAKWSEMAGDESTRQAAAERQRRHRKSVTSDGVTVTQNVTDKDKEEDKDKDKGLGVTLRPGLPKNWPESPGDLRSLSRTFVAVFANCADDAKAKKHVASYAPILARMRTRGCTVDQAWQSCLDAVAATGELLFLGQINRALDFLPAPQYKNGRPQVAGRVLGDTPND